MRCKPRLVSAFVRGIPGPEQISQRRRELHWGVQWGFGCTAWPCPSKLPSPLPSHWAPKGVSEGESGASDVECRPPKPALLTSSILVLPTFILSSPPGLKTPSGCELVVGGEPQCWAEGRCLLFDDSFLHTAFHEGECLSVLWPPLNIYMCMLIYTSVLFF